LIHIAIDLPYFAALSKSFRKPVDMPRVKRLSAMPNFGGCAEMWPLKGIVVALCSMISRAGIELPFPRRPTEVHRAQRRDGQP
jgi:hypothetical protein